jgi:two-component system, OmpR family, catabolic regulation response regulator CreB
LTAVSQPLILLLEDDPAIARVVAFTLQREGFGVETLMLVQQARERLQQAPLPAALVLDVGLPDGSGLDLCRWLRQGAGVALPVLMLSARGEEIDRVLGLELGADDYLAKPFSPRELVARLRALLRRPQPVAAAVPAPGAWFEHDEAGQRIAFDGRWLALTRLEYRLLASLLARPGRILARATLLDAAWGLAAEAGDRTVDTHIKTLRAKLREVRPELEPIATHRGLGYALELPPRG